MTSSAEARRPRDQRLDFFRGLAMFIILLAHTPGNAWTLWIPARFGFSDATEIFVFCSGMASALAFGTVFVARGWWMGAARVAYRVWQVYWAHIGVVLATALLMAILTRTGMGEPGKDYTQWFPVAGLFNRTEETLIGLFTLTYIPGLFDILPMYLVILGLIPVVMGAYRLAGREAALGLVAALWLLAQVAGWARGVEDPAALSGAGMALYALGDGLSWMNLPGLPWSDRATWFFNPFGWQLVFFTGFAFAAGWIAPPPVRRGLVIAAAAFVVFTIPFAWHKIFAWKTGYLPGAWGGEFLWDAREAIDPLRWKTWVGAWRYLHFLAVAYLAFAAVGPLGARLNTGWRPADRAEAARRRAIWVAAVVAVLTIPYAWLAEIKYAAPALDAWLFANWPLIPARWIGLAEIAHGVALIVIIWNAMGDARRRWLLGDGFLAVVPVIRKVGTQSLAVFMVSIVLSRFNGWWMDAWDAWLVEIEAAYFSPRDVWMRLVVNLTGFAILIATAYLVGWFKSQPWRKPAPARAAETPEAAPQAAERV